MKLLIVDDSNIIRKAIDKYLKDYDLEIVGSAGDGEAALKMVKEIRPDLVWKWQVFLILLGKQF
ncbi:MAG: response regulator [Spirochaetales bacterium]|nr:response regulator [Spirochaetales bacterium]